MMMSKFSQLQNQAGKEHLAEEWIHFAGVEIRHREIIALLEATAEEERVILKNAAAGRRLTLIPFTGAAKRLSEEKHHAEEELKHVRQRIAEENKTIADNEQRLHETMHDWLIEHDPVYRKSGEINRRLKEIRTEITTLTGLLVDMRSRYGSAINELAVSFDHKNHALSEVSLVALDGLMSDYERLNGSQRRFATHITELNALIDGTIYRDIKLCAFNPVGAPDHQKGMNYPTLHANFETGAKQVGEAIDRLTDDFDAAAPTSATLETLLFKYRDSLWKQYVGELNSGDAPALAG